MQGERRLGYPRLHLRQTDSTNARARELAQGGAPHGTLVTASEQLAGRGRQGRTWTAPADRALLCSVIVRDPPRLTPLAAGVAVAELVAELVPAPASVSERVAERVAEPAGLGAQIKWPNDVLLDGRKVAGILSEGRPQDRWVVLGIGLNVALEPTDFPSELRERAGTLGLGVPAIEPALTRMLELLERWLAAPAEDVLEVIRTRDALLGRPVRWTGGEGVGAGIDGNGRLLVVTADEQVALDSGEVHLSAGGP
jgi:BirA family biotin operon repressor/biotin-[acetyl-CoA-carboxylase] ligase